MNTRILVAIGVGLPLFLGAYSPGVRTTPNKNTRPFNKAACLAAMNDVSSTEAGLAADIRMNVSKIKDAGVSVPSDSAAISAAAAQLQADQDRFDGSEPTAVFAVFLTDSGRCQRLKYDPAAPSSTLREKVDAPKACIAAMNDASRLMLSVSTLAGVSDGASQVAAAYQATDPVAAASQAADTYQQFVNNATRWEREYDANVSKAKSDVRACLAASSH
jgi:hypothetical protein